MIEFVTVLSLILTIGSIIPYARNTLKEKIQVNLTSWLLWMLNGAVLLATYKASGAEENFWSTLAAVVNPAVILIILWRQRKWEKPTVFEIWCIVFGLVSLGLWIGLQDSQYALYMTIVADFFAALPTIIAAWKEPEHDRPFAWTLFSVGYGLALFTIPENTVANYAFPAYMCAFTFFGIALPLIWYRLRKKIPLREWV